MSSYYNLGRSGLRVSPLCLGAMTFGTEWGWGVPQDTVFALLDRYAAAGGNFIDTADLYTNGSSERLIGEWMRARDNRDRVVLATKFTFGGNLGPGNPNRGGNGRKAIMRSLEASLERLQTDYVDLYWLHAWDTVTPIDEVVRTLDDLVSRGLIRHIGLSDTPAWYAARAVTLAEALGRDKVIALQLEYSLVERNIEREHVPLALELGLGITPWSPLASGLLTGKLNRDLTGAKGRLTSFDISKSPLHAKYATARSFDIAEEVVRVASELGKTPAQVALNWVTKRPGVASTIIGATKLEQLDDNLAALEFDLPAELSRRLDEVSRIDLGFPYAWYGAGANNPAMSGGTHIEAEPPWWRR
jgi:aryl-alcohol dehydrogenase-like predicted oxidoreductase